MEQKEKEEKIYNQLMILQNGDYQDKSFAFDCVGYLGNEYIDDSLEKRLNIIEEKIMEYYNKKDKANKSTKY